MKDILQSIIDFIKSLMAKLPAAAAPTSPVILTTPWRKWFLDRLGWSETAHDKELSLGWPLVGLPQYHSVIGVAHAWCGMSLATALHSCGYAFPKGAAGAANWAGYGTSVNWKKVGVPLAAVVVIRHHSGDHHVTTANRMHRVGETAFEALGGNQGDKICVRTYNVSGNSNGVDEIVYVGLPVKA